MTSWSRRTRSTGRRSSSSRTAYRFNASRFHPPYHGWARDTNLNDAGEIAFTTGIDGGAATLKRSVDGTLTRILGSGQDVAGIGRVDAVSAARLLENGDVALQAGFDGKSSRVVTWSSTGIRSVCAPGDASFLGRLVESCSLPQGRLASSDVVFEAWASETNGVFRLERSGRVTPVVTSGRFFSDLHVDGVNGLMAVRGSAVAIAANTNFGGLTLVIDGSQVETLARQGERSSEWTWIWGVALAAG